MADYLLNPSGLPVEQVNWLEELETWSQRASVQVGWICVHEGGQWTAKIKCKFAVQIAMVEC